MTGYWIAAFAAVDLKAARDAVEARGRELGR
jgi:hypothetical protein